MHYFLLLTTICQLLWNVYSFEISKGDDVVTLTKVAAGYKLFMPENNHEMKFERALFSVSVRDSAYAPEISNDPGFVYKWENHGSTWTLFSESSFDYETQHRSYIIELKVGPQHKTFTLYIENIDDEPPSVNCSEDITFIDNLNYTLHDSPAECFVSDPDGFLNGMTFSLTGVHAKFFQMGFPDSIPDRVQTAVVKIENVGKLDYNLFEKALLNLVAKDGAGHNTVPDANVIVTITISHYD